jgi:hypothetical protein
MGILLVLVLIYATKSAWDDTRSAWGKSRSSYMKNAKKRFPGMSKSRRTGHAVRHDLGYGLSQLLHGFPQARHGFMSGWHQGRKAHAEALAGREKAKAEHLETRARLMPDLRDYRRRQKEALDRIRGDEPGEGSEPEPAEEVPEPASEPEPDGRTYSWGPENGPSGWPADDAETAHRWAEHMSTDGSRKVVTEYPPGGGPGKTIATYQDGKQAGTPGEGSPGEGEGSPDGTSPDPETTPSPSPEGSTPVSDTTFDSVIRQMEAVCNAEESSLADRRNSTRQANAAADSMQALHVDPRTLSAMADHLDAHTDAEKAQQRVMETAESVKAALERGHRDLNEAHQNAPVDAADKEFYEG